MNLKKSFAALTTFDRILWAAALAVVLVSGIIGRSSAVAVTAPLIGVTALVFLAKGDVLGQLLTVIFAIFYAVVSYTQRYYGEMITYVGMTAPMAAMAVISWLRHPFKDGEPQVRVARLTPVMRALIVPLTVAVTAAFYFILRALGNASLAVSTVSVATSFLASYLTFCRSSYYALAYAANDIVLITLWIIASRDDISYLSMVACFLMFLICDLYGFISWRRMETSQREADGAAQ